MYSFHSSVNYERLNLPKILLTPEVIIVRSDGMIHKIATILERITAYKLSSTAPYHIDANTIR